jgi:hypothetical protein
VGIKAYHIFITRYVLNVWPSQNKKPQKARLRPKDKTEVATHSASNKRIRGSRVGMREKGEGGTRQDAARG